MNVNTRTMYYNVFGRDNDGGGFYNPATGRSTYGLDIPRLDWVRIRLALTFGCAKIDAITRIPLPQYRVPIAEYSSALFALKTNAQYYNDGPLTWTNGGGFDGTDTAWQGAGVQGIVTLAPIVIPLTVISMEYFFEIILFRTAGSRWTLRPSTSGEKPPTCRVERDVYSGAESNAPSGLPGSITVPWTIADTATSVNVTIPNATSQTFLAIGMLAPTGGAGDAGDVYQLPLPPDGSGNPTPNTVRLSVGQAPGQGGAFNGKATLLIL